MAETAKIKLQYFRSMICAPTKQKLTIKGLGFTRLNQIIERKYCNLIVFSLAILFLSTRP